MKITHFFIPAVLLITGCSDDTSHAEEIGKKEEPETVLEESEKVDFKIGDSFFTVELPKGALLLEEEGFAQVYLDPESENFLKIGTDIEMETEELNPVDCQVAKWVVNIHEYTCYELGTVKPFCRKTPGVTILYLPLTIASEEEYKTFIGIAESVRSL